MTLRPDRSVDAVIWDLDGTLVDTVQLVYRATRHAVETCVPYPVSDDLLWSLFGKPVTEVWPAISPEHFRELEREFEDFYARHRRELVQPVDGVRETLDWLRASGIPMAILSNKRKSQGLEELEDAGLSHYFDFALFSEDLPRAKPEPDGLMMALERLGVEPQRALMVGDGHMDVLCAKNAGVPAVAALWTEWARRQRRQLEGLCPEYLFDDVRQLLPLVSPE